MSFFVILRREEKGFLMLMGALDSKRVLPAIYNSTMDARERRARELLQDLLEVSPTRAGKKRS